MKPAILILTLATISVFLGVEVLPSLESRNARTGVRRANSERRVQECGNVPGNCREAEDVHVPSTAIMIAPSEGSTLEVKIEPRVENQEKGSFSIGLFRRLLPLVVLVALLIVAICVAKFVGMWKASRRGGTLLLYSSWRVEVSSVPSCEDVKQRVERTLGSGLSVIGLNIVGPPLEVWHDNKAPGASKQYTLVWPLATSHLALHSYEENAVLIVDLVACGEPERFGTWRTLIEEFLAKEFSHNYAQILEEWKVVGSRRTVEGTRGIGVAAVKGVGGFRKGG